jgi:hypothetical protein
MMEALRLLQANEAVVEVELNRLDVCRRRVKETRLMLASVEKEVRILLDSTRAAGLDIETILADDDIDFDIFHNIHALNSDEF